MLAQCAACGEQRSVPHSCGHRACPHCQHHDSQWWLERQLQCQVPATYFLVTFTLPGELRSLAWEHQRVVYALLMQCASDTLDTFSRNDRQLRATPGAVGVLHTQHVLPKGLRRSHNFGFLHPNSARARAVRLLQLPHLRAAPPAPASTAPTRPAWRCVCGQPMRVVRRRMPLQADVAAEHLWRVVRPDKPEPAQAHTMH